MTEPELSKLELRLKNCAWIIRERDAILVADCLALIAEVHRLRESVVAVEEVGGCGTACNCDASGWPATARIGTVCKDCGGLVIDGDAAKRKTT